jgi:hypothetical protein
VSTVARSGFKDGIVSILICLALLFFIAPDLLAQTDSADQPQERPKGLSSLQKSLLFPGWGQLAEKHYLEGLFFLTAEVFCIYQIVRYNHKGNTHYSKYQNALSVDEAVSYRQMTEDYDKNRNLYLLAAAGIWAVNLLDIYVIVKSKQKLRLQLQRVGKKGMALSLRISF